MGALRCPKCGQVRVRRCPRVGILERAMSLVYVYPFRCQLCARRFRALQWGTRYTKQTVVDRREFDRLAVRAPLTVLSDRGHVAGEVTELSLQACTARLREPLTEGGTVQLQLDLLPGERPVVVEAALVRSTRGEEVGLYFVRVSVGEQLRIRRVLADLDSAQQGEVVPPPPRVRDGRRDLLRSADFWLAALLLVLATLAVSILVPTFSRCVWGVSC
jgi:hypothetical protein